MRVSVVGPDRTNRPVGYRCRIAWITAKAHRTRIWIAESPSDSFVAPFRRELSGEAPIHTSVLLDHGDMLRHARGPNSKDKFERELLLPRRPGSNQTGVQAGDRLPDPPEVVIDRLTGGIERVRSAPWP